MYGALESRILGLHGINKRAMGEWLFHREVNGIPFVG